MSDFLLKMENVTKRFFSVTALDGVTLHLKENEVLALVGENGAGKSTLMKILSGSYPSNTYDGDIYVDGNKMNFTDPSDAEKAGIQMIYQEISLMPDLTVAENMFIGNLPMKKGGVFVDINKMYSDCAEALSRIKLNVSPKELVRNLSTSQKQLLSIAKALYRNPKILVLDEPTSALTVKETDNLLEIIKQLRSEGISCIYISHKMDEIMQIADRITVLRDGVTVADFNKEDADLDKIIHAMVGREIVDMYPKMDIPIGDVKLKVEHLTVPTKVPGKNYVEDVSFEVHAGEIFGIGGLVGAGRSELVSAIFGYLPHSEGKVYVSGEELSGSSIKESIGKKLGFVTEDRKLTGFVHTMNIKENISLASFKKIFGKLFVKSDAEKTMTKEYFDKLKVKAPGINTNILSLSGGNQQKVVLAKWLMSDVEILILDEPTRGIDVGAKVEIYNIINELASNGAAIIMISSETPELLAMCDNLLVLADGKPTGFLSKADVTQDAYMRLASGVDQI